MKPPAPSLENSTHPDIQEILRKRREMLNRVRADLDKVGKLQETFRLEEERRSAERAVNPPPQGPRS